MKVIISLMVLSIMSIFGMEQNQLLSRQLFADYVDARSHFTSTNDLKIQPQRYQDDGKSLVWQPSDRWFAIYNDLNGANDVYTRVACLKSLSPAEFWMFYHDCDYYAALKESLLVAFHYVIMNRYYKDNDYGTIDLKLNQDMPGQQMNDDLDSENNDVDPDDEITTEEILVSDPFSTYNFRLNVRELQSRFFQNRIEQMVVQDGALDLTNQIILDIKTDINPDHYQNNACEVKKLLLDKNYLYCPSLVALREIFPNVETISFKKCPLKMPEQEGSAMWVNDLYAMHQKLKNDPVKVWFPCYGEVIIGYLPGYCPLTICLSPDGDPTVAKAFEYVAATQWYNMNLIVLKTSKMFFYTISLISIVLGWAAKIHQEAKEPYKVNFDKEKDQKTMVDCLMWCLDGISEEYRSDWVYKKRPQIIFEQ